MKGIELYTDGACRGNPGPGGWGALLKYGGSERELYGGETHTTNNRMELLAAIEGLTAIEKSCAITLTTDSTYVMKGITRWLAQWKRRGWKTAARKPVANADLWRRLDEQNRRHAVTWRWIKGHSGHPGNERADALANRGIDELTAKR